MNQLYKITGYRKEFGYLCINECYLHCFSFCCGPCILGERETGQIKPCLRKSLAIDDVLIMVIVRKARVMIIATTTTTTIL